MLAIYQIVWIVTQIISGNAPAVAFPVFVAIMLIVGSGLSYKLWRMTPEAQPRDVEKGKEERIQEPAKPQETKPVEVKPQQEAKTQEEKPTEPTDVKIQA
jgi:hypothetical protein